MLLNIPSAPDTLLLLKLNKPLGIDVKPVQPLNVSLNIYEPLPVKLENNVLGIEVNPEAPLNVPINRGYCPSVDPKYGNTADKSPETLLINEADDWKDIAG